MTTLVTLLFLFFSSLLHTIHPAPIELYGLNYNSRQGADWNPDKCKTYEQVLRDLTLLTRVTNRIRILSLYDCGQGELVLQIARELGNIQLWIGLWVSADPTVFESELALLEDFVQRGWIDSSLVLGISVGSESIYRQEVTIDENIELMNQVKSLLQENGLGDMLVTICDIAPTYQHNERLTDAVDIVITNSFPFWESIPIDSATDYLVEEHALIEAFAAPQGKEILLGETGWPSDGFISGVGTASEENQVQFFVDFYCRMGQELNWMYYWFTGINGEWRQEQDPNNTIEGTWGFLYDSLELKPGFQGLTFTCPSNGVQYSFDETDWSIPEISMPPTISPAPASAASCQAHAGCASLAGNCCPNDDGLFLGCCDSGETTTGNSTLSPTPTVVIVSEPTATLAPMFSTSMTPAPSIAQEAPTGIQGTPTVAPSMEGDMDASGWAPAGNVASTSTPEPTPTLEDFLPETSSANQVTLTCCVSMALILVAMLQTLL